MPDTLFKSYLEKGQTLRTYLIIRVLEVCQLTLLNGGGVEDTMLEAKAKDQGYKRKCSRKKVFKIFFQVISKKNGLEKIFSVDLQNFNHSKNSAVLEPRTGQFSRT